MTALASSGRDPVPVAADEAAQAGPGFVVDPAPKAWRLGLGASVFLHGTAAAAILFSLTSVSSAERPTDAAMTVEIAPAPSAPPAPPRQTPPGPQQIQSVAKPRPLDMPKIPPLPRVITPVKPEVALQTREQPQPDRPVQKQTADQTTAPQALAAPPKTETAAPTMGASASASNAPQTWESLLLAKLEQNKRYPGAAQAQGQEDVVYVRMSIDRRGRLVGAQIVHSHGFPMLDGEVMSLTHRASPYPAPPVSEAGDPIIVVVPVQFFVTHHRG
jgi:protein TonB